MLKRALTFQKDGSPSFADCLVMALVDEYATSYVPGFDATFRKDGYQLPVVM
jgi:hypothetical protein